MMSSIDGIKILNVIKEPYMLENILISILFIALLFGTVIPLCIFLDEECNEPRFLILSIIMLVLTCITCVIGREVKRNNVTQYQAIIDDSVSFNDFFEKYKVVDRNGDIFTIIDIPDKGKEG